MSNSKPIGDVEIKRDLATFSIDASISKNDSKLPPLKGTLEDRQSQMEGKSKTPLEFEKHFNYIHSLATLYKLFW
jgi:hypothetical protein